MKHANRPEHGGKFLAQCKKCGRVGKFANRPGRCPQCGGKMKTSRQNDYTQPMIPTERLQ